MKTGCSWVRICAYMNFKEAYDFIFTPIARHSHSNWEPMGIYQSKPLSAGQCNCCSKSSYPSWRHNLKCDLDFKSMPTLWLNESMPTLWLNEKLWYVQYVQSRLYWSILRFPFQLQASHAFLIFSKPQGAVTFSAPLTWLFWRVWGALQMLAKAMGMFYIAKQEVALLDLTPLLPSIMWLWTTQAVTHSHKHTHSGSLLFRCLESAQENRPYSTPAPLKQLAQGMTFDRVSGGQGISFEELWTTQCEESYTPLKINNK